MLDLKPHVHKWASIRPGYPQKICKCGEMKVGTNTVLLGDRIRYDSTSPSARLGDLGMNVARGEPNAFMNWRARMLGPHARPHLRREWFHQARGTASLIDSFGNAAPTALGTPAQVVTQAYNSISYTSAVLNGDMGWISTAFTETEMRQAPCGAFFFTTPADIAAVRIWIGFCTASPMGSSTPHMLGFRYDTGVDGTAFWRAYTHNGVSSVASATSVAIVASRRYGFLIETDSAATGGGAYLSIATVDSNPLRCLWVPVASWTTTQVPTSDLGWVVMCRNLSAVSRSPQLARVHMTSGLIVDAAA